MVSRKDETTVAKTRELSTYCATAPDVVGLTTLEANLILTNYQNLCVSSAEQTQNNTQIIIGAETAAAQDESIPTSTKTLDAKAAITSSLVVEDSVILEATPNTKDTLRALNNMQISINTIPSARDILDLVAVTK